MLTPRRRTARRPRKSATASPRPGRTTAAPRAIRAPGRRRKTTHPTNGSTCPRARARRWAARPRPAAPIPPRRRSIAPNDAVTARATARAGVGIGLRARPYGEILERRPAPAFIAVHTEHHLRAAAAAALH